MANMGEIVHNILGQLQRLADHRNGAPHDIIARQARNVSINLFHEFCDVAIRFGNARQIYFHRGRNGVALLIQIKAGVWLNHVQREPMHLASGALTIFK